ncbi:hypothetical protein [Candidatus Pelagibacter communis]|uniref:hypothetical protein n=1 Tax=Pelagibacter ubique TaxID=198252 RepID=UPI00094D4826|nr:hypothetical protein [Candidatus Pelagibacter ubique]
MNDIYYNRYFILIKKNKILFQALDMENKVILTKENFIQENASKDNFVSIRSFLEKNIFELEKHLNDHIKEICVILESDLFFVVANSIKYNSQKNNIKFTDINDTLVEIKNQFKKYSSSNEIIHMIFDKYIASEDDNFVNLKNMKNENLVIQVKFICLKDQIVNDLKEIFFKYQISVKKILSYDYLKQLNDYDGKNIFKLADYSLNGLNKNEVLITNNSPKTLGFFEKFFNFFR